MKLLRTNVRVNPRDSLGQGLDAVITLVLFFIVGFGLDRWLGTTPWMMIAFTVLASVGIFYRLKLGYEARMDELVAERNAARSTQPVPAAPVPANPVSRKAVP